MLLNINDLSMDNAPGSNTLKYLLSIFTLKYL